MTVALDLSPHLRAARRALLYLFVGLGQGLTYLLVIGGGLVLGVVLAPLWVGLPILAGTARLTWRLAEGERRQANRLLETHLPPVAPCRGAGVREQLGNRAFWRVLAMLLLKLPIALLGLCVAAAPVVLAVALAGLGVSGLAGDDGRLVGPWALGPARRDRAVPARAARPRSSRSRRWRASARRCAGSPGGCCARAWPRAARCASCWPSGSATAR